MYAPQPDQTTTMSTSFAQVPPKGQPQASHLARLSSSISVAPPTTPASSDHDALAHFIRNRAWPPNIEAMLTGVTAPNYLVHLINKLDVQLHAVDQINERVQTSIVNWENILQDKALEHEHRIDRLGKFVTEKTMKISTLADTVA